MESVENSMVTGVEHFSRWARARGFGCYVNRFRADRPGHTRSLGAGRSRGRGYHSQYRKYPKFQNPRSIKKGSLQGRKCRKTRGQYQREREILKGKVDSRRDMVIIG